MLPEGVPPRTLGWQVLDWISANLAQPDGDGAGGPFVLTNEQARFVSWLYAVDARGAFVYRRAVLSRVKGWGKSPLLAALCCAELAGPVVFDGDDANGDPVGRPHPSPWVQLAAVSEDQTDNTMRLVVEMLRLGEPDIPGLDIGITRVNTAYGTLQPVTADSRSREGQRTTFAVLDETHLWLPNNGGKRLAATIRRNLAKMNGRSVETTNAFRPGEESVAESSHDFHVAIREGKVRDSGLLYDHRVAPADTKLTDERSLRRGLRVAYGDAVKWIDLDRIVAEVYDPATDPSDARRFYLNMFTAADDAWLSAPEWDARADASFVVPDGAAVTLGFDGSLFDDATALVGCDAASGHVFLLGCWERPEGAVGWQVPQHEVDAAVAAAFDRFRVVLMHADPPHWQERVAAWQSEFGAPVVEWWTNRPRAMVAALERFHTAVVSGEMSHDGGSELRRHVLNARRRVSRSGLGIGKEHPKSPRKIDAAVAAVLAFEARADALSRGLLAEKKRSGRVVGW